MKNIIAYFFLLISFLVMSSGSIFAQINWTKYTGNPVFPGGPDGSWYKGVLTSCVLYNSDSSRYELFFNGSAYGAGDRPWRIGLATSTNGINWTVRTLPVLAPRPDKFDYYSVENPYVIRQNGQYKMWYQACEPGFWSMKTGYASSTDGINWTRLDYPVMISGSQAWEAGGIGTGCIIPYEGGYKMWYIGATTSGYNEKICIGFATSADGISWQRDTNHNPVLVPGATGQWDGFWVIQPRVLFINNLYYMYYTGTNGSFTNYKVGLAVSSDGINWQKRPENPVLLPSSSGWDDGFAETGDLLLRGDSLCMWYNGRNQNSPYAWKTGLAVSKPFSPLPVELTVFDVRADDLAAILSWSTATETNNLGFEVQRKSIDGEFATIGFVRGQGTSTSPRNYTYTDKFLAGTKYFYRLKQNDYNGNYHYSAVVEIDVRSLDKYSLEQNYPNPFNPATTIGYILKERSSVNLVLLNSIGEEVALLSSGEQEKGYHKVEFNAVNLSSGIYFYRLEAGNFIQIKKMILLK